MGELEILLANCDANCVTVALPTETIDCNDERLFGNADEILFVPCLNNPLVDEASILDTANWATLFGVGGLGRRIKNLMGSYTQAGANPQDVGKSQASWRLCERRLTRECWKAT